MTRKREIKSQKNVRGGDVRMYILTDMKYFPNEEVIYIKSNLQETCLNVK